MFASSLLKYVVKIYNLSHSSSAYTVFWPMPRLLRKPPVFFSACFAVDCALLAADLAPRATCKGQCGVKSTSLHTTLSSILGTVSTRSGSQRGQEVRCEATFSGVLNISSSEQVAQAAHSMVGQHACLGAERAARLSGLTAGCEDDTLRVPPKPQRGLGASSSSSYIWATKPVVKTEDHAAGMLEHVGPARGCC